MKVKDNERQKNERLSDLEQEAKQKGEYLRTKANELMQEQEDEIKFLNEVSYTQGRSQRSMRLKSNIFQNYANFSYHILFELWLMCRL